jgi:hypothetical protein
VRNATIYKDEVSRSDWDSVKEGEKRVVLDRI